MTAVREQPGQREAALPNEYLTFRLGTEEYAIDILKVQEIRGYEKPTRIANAPAHVKGVVNLRGSIVPIVDLRVKFEMPSVEYNEFTAVIVLDIASQEVGIVVDSVSDVMALTPGQIRPAPKVGSVSESDFVLGLGCVGDRMLILVEIERLMSATELAIPDLA